MKVKLLVGMLSIVMALAACTNDTTSDNTQKKQNEKKKQEIKVVEEKAYKYAGGLTYSAVIKNESKKTLNVYDLKINYINKRDKLEQNNVPASVRVAPYILKPGEKAYVSAEGAIDISNFKNYDVKMTVPDVKPANDVMKLVVDKNSVKNDKDIQDDETITHITGTVTNSTKKSVQYIMIGAGMYGKNHEFIGTTFDDLQEDLKPGESTSFDSYSAQIPKKELDKVKTYKVSASTYFEK
ncbi:FxLYD domain-containing protein [Priestia megaterium]|uniref:FxLYD domain-containing protein n=1 Tax=Priestia megaterium TaxID=1404 RepID=UPI001950D95F|nr:FxLYD domain-containing protein [Priestia megaterium]MBM6601930.1 hypothetical protein [Priestia megaterium]